MLIASGDSGEIAIAARSQGDELGNGDLEADGVWPFCVSESSKDLRSKLWKPLELLIFGLLKRTLSVLRL